MRNTLLVIVFIIVFAIVFINTYPSFGKKPSKDDKKVYEKKVDYYYNNKFHNKEEFSLMAKVEGSSLIRDKFKKYVDKKPKEKIPVVKIKDLPKADLENIRVVWFGHSTSLLQVNGMNILIDPVLCGYASPLSFIGPKRISEYPMEIEDLPEIDIVLISHDHYDHLDYKTIKKIDKKVKKYCVPLGVESRLKGWGVENRKINSLSWYDEVDINGIKVISTPSQHFSNRSINDSGSTLWCGFIIENKDKKIYYTGDTGSGEFFNDVYKRYGAIDLMLCESGQYDKLWPRVHMSPEQSLKAAETVKAKYVIPVHWAGFVLANHPWYEPPQKIIELEEKKNSPVTIITPKIGEIINYDEIEYYKERWWK